MLSDQNRSVDTVTGGNLVRVFAKTPHVRRAPRKNETRVVRLGDRRPTRDTRSRRAQYIVRVGTRVYAHLNRGRRVIVRAITRVQSRGVRAQR